MGLPLAKQSGGLFSVRAAQGANPATPVRKPFLRVFLAEIHVKKVFFYAKKQLNLRVKLRVNVEMYLQSFAAAFISGEK